jgi:hypothetical protein
MSDIPYPDTPQPDIPVLPEPDMPTTAPEVGAGTRAAPKHTLTQYVARTWVGKPIERPCNGSIQPGSSCVSRHSEPNNGWRTGTPLRATSAREESCRDRVDKVN